MSGRLERIWLKRFKRGPMDPADEVTLEIGRGIVNNADQGGQRQVLIIEEEVWASLMRELKSDLDPSARRANLMVSQLGLRGSSGKLLHVGDCRIRIVGESQSCERMDEALPGLHRAMARSRSGGAYGVVEVGGVIQVGAPVRLE